MPQYSVMTRSQSTHFTKETGTSQHSVARFLYIILYGLHYFNFHSHQVLPSVEDGVTHGV